MRRSRQQVHDQQVTDLTRALEYELRENERDGFRDMLQWMEPPGGHRNGPPESERVLSDKQVDWLEHVLGKHEPKYENLYSSGKLPPATRDIPINCGPKVLSPPGRPSR